MSIFVRKPVRYTSYRISAKLFLNRVLKHFKWRNTYYRKIIANCCGIMVSLVAFDEKRTKKLNENSLKHEISLYHKLFNAYDASVVPIDHADLSMVADYTSRKAKLVITAFMARYDLTTHDLSHKALYNLKFVKKLVWQQGLED